MPAPTVDTLIQPIFKVSLHSLEHIDGYVGGGLANVGLGVFQGPWFVGVNQGFQITPQEKVTWGQIWGARRPRNVTPQGDEAPVEMFPQKLY